MDIQSDRLKPMSYQYQGPGYCYFCKSARNIKWWAFTNVNDMTKAVACCDRCAREIARKEKQENENRNQNGRIREILQHLHTPGRG